MHPIYVTLSRAGFLSRSYLHKFLFIAGIAICLPLIGLSLFLLLVSGPLSASIILLLTAAVTVLAIVTAYFLLKGLLSPLYQSQQTLKEYLTENEMPRLPVHYTDEMGELMQLIQQGLIELNNLLEEKKDLNALLSQDMRIPLRNVQTFAGLLQQQPLSAEQVKEIGVCIEDASNEQQLLLDNILQILRMDYLFQHDQQKSVALQDMVQDTLLKMMPMAHHKSITLSVDMHYTGMVEVQPDLFRQVLKNLVSNAIKFSHPSSKVKIQIYRRNGQILIDVTDQGIGFDQPTGERLFDRFTNIRRQGTAGEPARGLGLYLSRKIIRHQRGELHAHSAGAGLGSTFTISLN
jgi:signal transduction histidine kinase